MPHEITRNVAEGQERLRMFLEWMGEEGFEGIDVTLKRKTLEIGPDHELAKFISNWAVDIRTGQRKPVPIDDEYSLNYVLQPSGMQLTEHEIADRSYHYHDSDRFEEEVHYQAGLILEAVRRRFPAARIGLQLPDEDEPRVVDDAVLEDLKGQLTGPVALIGTAPAPGSRSLLDRIGERLNKAQELLQQALNAEEEKDKREPSE